jgi:hypothetical protein
MYILLALIVLAQSIGLGATIYNNTVTDTGDTLFFSVAPYSEIGDVIQVSGTERFATRAWVQFFNGGTSGAFDATFRIYALGLSSGSPVGGQIGSDYMVKNQTAPRLASFDIAFDMSNIMVPGQFVFTVSVTNVVGGADLGLNLFDPPTVGSSANAFLITRDASGFSESTLPGNDANLYFQMTASDVISPEPSTIVLVSMALMGALLGRPRGPSFRGFADPLKGMVIPSGIHRLNQLNLRQTRAVKTHTAGALRGRA